MFKQLVTWVLLVLLFLVLLPRMLTRRSRQEMAEKFLAISTRNAAKRSLDAAYADIEQREQSLALQGVGSGTVVPASASSR